MAETEEKQNVKATAELFGAIVLFSQLSTAGLILALAERPAVDANRVFAFYSTLADAIETGQAGRRRRRPRRACCARSRRWRGT